jgi:DNA-binding MarR family transcriptional regulator
VDFDHWLSSIPGFWAGYDQSGGYNIVKSIHNGASSEKVGAAVEQLFELTVLLGDAMERGLAERGLTLARAELLWRLRRRGPATQRQLSEDLRCTPRNVTGLVDALETAGLVERRPHPTDRRATLVTLTHAGSQAAATMDAGYEATGRELFNDFAEDELRAFVSGMDRVLGRIRKASGSNGSR